MGRSWEGRSAVLLRAARMHPRLARRSLLPHRTSGPPTTAPADGLPRAPLPPARRSLSYLLFTITDGAVRMIVLLHAYSKGFSAMVRLLPFSCLFVFEACAALRCRALHASPCPWRAVSRRRQAATASWHAQPACCRRPRAVLRCAVLRRTWPSCSPSTSWRAWVPTCWRGWWARAGASNPPCSQACPFRWAAGPGALGAAWGSL